MQVLKERKTQREFSPEKLPMQVLANLLWAAFGINRPDGGRTAPSAMNWQEIDIYVALGDGLFLYNAKANRLEPILAQDMRGHGNTSLCRRCTFEPGLRRRSQQDRTIGK
jgi:hypothetical protein